MARIQSLVIDGKSIGDSEGNSGDGGDAMLPTVTTMLVNMMLAAMTMLMRRPVLRRLMAPLVRARRFVTA
eukprot:14177389-Alexandrium_andersonii.AAC.1